MSDIENYTVTNKKVKVKKSKGKSKFWLLMLISVCLMIISFIISYSYAIKSGEAVKKLPEIPSEKAIQVEIPLGSTTTSISKVLYDKKLIKFPSLFKLLSKINGYDGNYKSGTHTVSKDLDYDELMRVFTSNPASKKVTIPEGLNFNQILERLSDAKLVNKTSFKKTANSEKYNYKFLEGLPERQNKLEGYLFPNTYEFGLKATDKDIIKKMLDEFDKVFKQEFYTKAKERNMSVDNIITLASIIEKEASDPNERKTIAGVFYNRLNNKNKTLRKLESCATIEYALYMRDGAFKEKLTNDDTKIESPYNTYENEGLPLGPICSPSLSSIEAALNPEVTDYLYFVAKGDGTHQFSKTFDEHINASNMYGGIN